MDGNTLLKKDFCASPLADDLASFSYLLHSLKAYDFLFRKQRNDKNHFYWFILNGQPIRCFFTFVV